MILECHGDLFKAHVDALVNPVNTCGVMGAGLARDFKMFYPEMFLEYQKKCQSHEIKVGKLHLYDLGKYYAYPRYIINFPTKIRWNEPSRLDYIKKGLKALTDLVYMNGINSIAIPPLGCGLGGLDWQEVKPLIEKWAKTFPNLDIKLYLPREHYVRYHRRITSLSA